MRVLILFLASVLFTGCEALRTINVEVTSESTVRASPVGGLFGGIFDDFVGFDVSESAEFENNDATRRNIGNASVTKFNLKVTSPDGATLKFIDSMDVYISDGESDPVLVAYLPEGQDTDVRELVLTVFRDADIGQFLRAEKTVVDVDVSGSPPDQDTTIEATIGFRIELVF